ncbi:MAG: glycosyltransferase family 39 protein [Ignavibacteria bacterium]|nr:glycosyltransferase family 39 protein [Ignavibacteria bacterium]
MLKSESHNSLNKQEWLLLFIVFLVSAAVRLKINYSTEYIGGGNGAFYLVLVRNLLEKGDLVYKEFPLIFWLEAGLAYIPLKLGLMNMNAAIDFSSRMFDSIIPTLSIFPAYFLTKKLLGENVKPLATVIIASTSVLYISFFILVSDFQKNALGLLWLFSLLYWLLKVHEEKSLKNIFFAALFLFLIAVTHYGCIAVAIAIVAVDLLIKYALKFSWKKLAIGFCVIIIVNILIYAIVYFVSPWRAESLLEAPMKLFKNPVLFFILKKEPVVSPIDLVTIVLINMAALISLYQFIRKFKSLNEKHRGFVLTMILISLFLSSPFLGLEIAQRLFFISYLTALPLIAFVYKELDSVSLRKAVMGFLSLVLAASTLLSFGRPNYSNMNKTLYAEMTKLKNVLPEEERTLIVARHGLEFWSSWIFRNMAVRQEELAEVYWRWYTKVYFLIQKKDKSPFGPAGLFGNPFPEPAIPEKSVRVFENEYFVVYKCVEPPKDFSIFIERSK